MSDHLVLSANRLITSASMGPMQGPHLAGRMGPSRERNYVYSVANGDWDAEEFRGSDEREADGERMDCRICHEEDFTKKMETPCACNGSLKFAHWKCVQRWCNENKNTICEICHQLYQAGYAASYVPCAEDTALDIREGLHIPGKPREVHFQRVVAATAEEEHLLYISRGLWPAHSRVYRFSCFAFWRFLCRCTSWHGLPLCCFAEVRGTEVASFISLSSFVQNESKNFPNGLQLLVL